VRALAVVLAAGCGTPMPSWVPDAGPCVSYMTPIDLTTPKVSFTADVVPIFQQNCISASCHGLAGSPKGDLFLGALSAHGNDSGKVHSDLVGVTTAQLPTMKFVAVGDPTHSYLMHKLDNDQCMFQSNCVAADCQQSMPFSDNLLPDETRDIVRRWIAQGALDN
jgi:hypothetical protein